MKLISLSGGNTEMTARNRLTYTLFFLLSVGAIYGIPLLSWPYVQKAGPELRQLVAQYFVFGVLAWLIGGALILAIIRGET